MRISVDASSLEDAADEIERLVLIAFKKIALTGFSKIVLRSPVDQGRFRMNWTVTVGSPSSSTTEAVDKSGSIAISNGQKAILGLQELNNTYFTNNLPYARRLENGWSKQAPAGMVALTLAEISMMGNVQ